MNRKCIMLDLINAVCIVSSRYPINLMLIHWNLTIWLYIWTTWEQMKFIFIFWLSVALNCNCVSQKSSTLLMNDTLTPYNDLIILEIKKRKLSPTWNRAPLNVLHIPQYHIRHLTAFKNNLNTWTQINDSSMSVFFNRLLSVLVNDRRRTL